MKIKDILSSTSFEEVAGHISLHYGNGHIEKFRTLYEKLRNQDSRKTSGERFSIIIRAFRDERLQETFDENDTSLYFDVSAVTDDDDFLYSIAGVDKSEFPEYNVAPETLKLFSYPAVIAHCLWEITCFSFE